MDDGVKRVSRLVDQMRFLARDRLGKVESVPVKQLIEEAFREARAYHPSASVLLQYRIFRRAPEPLMRPPGLAACLCRNHPQRVPGQHCFLSSAGPHPFGDRFRRLALGADRSAGQRGGIQRRGCGKGLRALFYDAKVGLGLGLAVTNKIIQTHLGKLEIPAPDGSSPGLVRISLPLDPLVAPSPKSAAN